jgi:hypothetical protein
MLQVSGRRAHAATWAFLGAVWSRQLVRSGREVVQARAKTWQEDGLISPKAQMGAARIGPLLRVSRFRQGDS